MTQLFPTWRGYRHWYMLQSEAEVFALPLYVKERNSNFVVNLLLNALLTWGILSKLGSQPMDSVRSFEPNNVGTKLVPDLCITALLVGMLPVFFVASKIKVGPFGNSASAASHVGGWVRRRK
jgi:hypothetical protein